MFTDQDLKRLKFALENHAPNWFDKDNLTGLISRLEAAERLLATENKKGHIDPVSDEFFAWRKAAGK